MIFRLLVKPFGNIWKLKNLCQVERGNILTPLHRFIYNAYQFEHGSAISYKAIFTSPPTLPVGTKQIIISDAVKIGKNCVIFQQVSIQSDTLPNSNLLGTPVIGDNCYIYPGVKIIGNVSIGDNVRIAPNVVITEDIPSHTLVYASKQIIHTEKNDILDKYYTYINNQWQYLQDNTSYVENDKEILDKLNNKFEK